MATGKMVKLGDQANIFHDQATGITIRKGEAVKLNAIQLNSKRIKNAIQGGHLVYTSEPAEENDSRVNKEEHLKTIKNKLVKLKEKGLDPSKACEAFTLEDLKNIADNMGIEVEADDTKATIVEALFEELESAAEEIQKKK